MYYVFPHGFEPPEAVFEDAPPPRPILGKQRQSAIDICLRSGRMQLERELRILVVGAHGCGKSTLLKQLVCVFGNGFSEVWFVQKECFVLS